MENFKNQNQILKNIQKDLFPEINPVNLILKIFALHLLATAFVMSFCPQFGLGIFENVGMGLTMTFMQVSHEFCQLMCGFLLTTASATLILISLKITEKEWLIKNKYITMGLMFCITSGFFWMQAPGIHIYEFSIWACGSLVSLFVVGRIEVFKALQ